MFILTNDWFHSLPAMKKWPIPQDLFPKEQWDQSPRRTPKAWGEPCKFVVEGKYPCF